MWTLCSGPSAFWMPALLARSMRSRIPLYPDQGGRAETGRTRLPHVAHQLTHGFEARWAGPYSSPRAARISGVNAGNREGLAKSPARQDSRSQAQ